MKKIVNFKDPILRTVTFVILVAILLLQEAGIEPANAQEENPTSKPTLAATPEPTLAATSEPTPATTSEPTLAATPVLTPTATLEPTPTATSTSAADEATASLTSITLEEWVKIALLALVVYILAHFVGIFVVWIARIIVRRTSYKIDDELFKAIRPQVSWLLAALGFQIATNRMAITSTAVIDFLDVAYYVLYWAAFMAIAWRLVDIVVIHYSQRLDSNNESDKKLSDRGMLLLERITHVVLAILGVVILLNHFGVQMLAVASAIGLTGFAISLAAKDTITNIISGLVIMFDHPFSIGDRIDVPALGCWGDVVEIGMRTTKVQTRDNRMVLIPNSSVVDNNVVNYSKPDTTYRLQTDIGIGGEEKIGDVVRILTEAVRQVEGVFPDKSVDVLFTGFGDDGNTFRVRWWVYSYADKRKVTHRVCSAIQDAATKEGINMPNKTYSLDTHVVIHEEDEE